MRRVAITGIGVVSPLGNAPDALFAALAGGRSGVRRFAPEIHARLSTRIAAPALFDGAALFGAARLRMLDRVSQFALFAARQALDDARLALPEADPARAGVFLGTGMGGAQTTDDAYESLYGQQSDRVKPFSVLLAMNNAAAAWIGLEHRISGPNLTYTTACSSSAVAIGEAGRRIASGEADVMLAGGAEAPLALGPMKAWEALHTLASEDPDDPSASCKPFARDRSGMVLGEGAAILILEELERAVARGAPIRAELAGYGLATDVAHLTRPSAEGQARAMRLALASGSMAPSAIDYINAHGTGTLANDAAETEAIRQVFGARAYRIPVSSTKSMHGHLLGAAGALEFAAAILAIGAGVIPPTAHLALPDPECDLDYVPNQARAATLDTVMSNSFAFGGTNAVLLARRLR